MIREMAALFQQNAPKRLGEAREAAARGDVAGFERAVHSLKSMAANLGARELRAVAGVLEHLAERGQVTASAELEAELAEAVRRVRDALARITDTADERKRIAIVEDNVDNRLLLHVLLEERYEVSEYETGVEALRDLPRRRPHVVLMDISLPGMDGFAVLRVLRADPSLRDLPVIAVTAHVMTGDRERCLAEGFDEYVPKPVEEEGLLGAIERCLRPRAA